MSLSDKLYALSGLDKIGEVAVIDVTKVLFIWNLIIY